MEKFELKQWLKTNLKEIEIEVEKRNFDKLTNFTKSEIVKHVLLCKENIKSLEKL